MATTTAGASHGGTRNDGATVVFGGAFSTTDPVTVAPDKSLFSHHSGVHGAAVPQPTATSGTYKPYASGTFAYVMEAGKFVGRRFAGYMSGVAVTHLESGSGSGTPRSIHRTESDRRYHITSWDYVTGAATKGGSAGASFNYHNIRGSGNIDDAAYPTRTIPGEFVYTEYSLSKDGVPTQADYDAAT